MLSGYNAEWGPFDKEQMAHRAENSVIPGPVRKKLVSAIESAQVFI